MKITLVYPKFERFFEARPELMDLTYVKNLGNFKMPPALGIPIISALTGDEHEIILYDENVEEIDYDHDTDIVGVSFFTPQASYAFEVAKKFKERGRTVIAGGMHPSIMPEEVSQYFDAVCVGEVELVWHKILNDFQNNKLQQFYKGGYPEMSQVPIPNRSIFEKNKNYDWSPKLVQVMRGCCFNCENCIVPPEFGKGMRFKDIDSVIKDITAEKIKGDFYLIDDTLVLPHKACFLYREQLMEACSKLTPKPRFFMSGSLNMNTTKEYLKTLVDGGVVSLYLVTGCDLLSNKAFEKGNKLYFDSGINTIKDIQDAGIDVFMSVGFGFDHQDKSVFDTSLEFLRKANISTTEFYITTPFPQTPMWKKMKEEDRILHHNWTKWNTSNVVFKPKNMTEKELLDGYIHCWREYYKNEEFNESL